MLATVAVTIALVPWAVPVPNVPVIAAPCPSNPAAAEQGRACATPDAIYAPTPLQPVQLAHELGHVWDLQHMNDADHVRWEAMAGLVGPWWWSSQAADSGYANADPPPIERFADAFALCAMGKNWRALVFFRRPRPMPFFGTYGEDLPRRVVANTCWLVTHTG